MKLRILILSIFGTFIFNSCTSDSNSSNQNNNSGSVLPKTIIITDDGGTNFQYDFFYNGNKIDHINKKVSGIGWDGNNFEYNSVEYYTYSGNFITQINYSPSGGVNFTYQNGKLINVGSNISFQYEQDGTITHRQTNSGSEYLISMTNNTYGLPSSIHIYEDCTINGTNSTISYNTSNSAYKNILGFNSILSNLNINPFSVISANWCTTGGICPIGGLDKWNSSLSPINNYSTINYTTPVLFNQNTFNYSYIYNANNYPTSYQVFDAFGQPVEYGTIIYY
jgi:hypothetical protein